MHVHVNATNSDTGDDRNARCPRATGMYLRTRFHAPDLATLDSTAARRPAAASGSQDLNVSGALLFAVVAEAGIVRAMRSVNLFSWARSPKGRETLPHVNDDIIEEISFAIEFERLYSQSSAIQGIARAYKL